MANSSSASRPSQRKAYVVTGPTSGMGFHAALELAGHGTVVLVGRDRARLERVRKLIERKGRHAVAVLCDLSDPASVRRAAAEIIALGLPLVGLLNNAGIMQMHPTRNALGWDMSFATNHLGPFALTEALLPHLADGANVVFVTSAVEDPERKPAVAAGFRGGRYISAQASAGGEWQPGGSKRVGNDAYATSKQGVLVTALAFARETPRLRFSAVEPGLTPATGLGRDAGAFVRFLAAWIVPMIVPLLLPFVEILSTPKRAGHLLAERVLDPSGKSGVYYGERGQIMQGSTQAHDPRFQDRVVAETRALLATLPT
jgi:NAD(P)-dependent dehydrogenase (short-subunit alcohol dehydrogenase family)